MLQLPLCAVGYADTQKLSKQYVISGSFDRDHVQFEKSLYLIDIGITKESSIFDRHVASLFRMVLL